MMNRQPENQNSADARKSAGRHGGHLPHERAQPIMVPNQVVAMPVVLTGFVTLVPHTVLDAIAMTNCLMVVQCIEPLEIFTGIETANRYVIHDMYLRPMVYCNERSNFLSRQMSGNDRNFVMEMRDLFGAPLMNAHRRKSCSCDDYLATEFLGMQIGVLKKECCDSNFQLLAAGCNQPIIIASPSCLSMSCSGTQVFPIVTASGQRIGDIVRLYPGFIQDYVSDADTFLVHFPVDMPPILKLLLISSVFLIDFTYFEKEG